MFCLFFFFFRLLLDVVPLRSGLNSKDGESLRGKTSLCDLRHGRQVIALMTRVCQEAMMAFIV